MKFISYKHNSIGELTIGDYLRQSGIRTGVVGKTHMRPDLEGMSRLGITKDTEIGLIVSEPGFDPYERDSGGMDGLCAVPVIGDKNFEKRRYR